MKGIHQQGAADGVRAAETRSGAPLGASVIVHPRTGEVLDALQAQPAERLADAYAAIVAEQKRLKDAAAALKGELQNRLAVRGVAVMTVGDWEVGEQRGESSRWDGQELEQVVRELLDAGAVELRDVEGLIKHETKVDGNAANRLSRRLVGTNKAAVEACRTKERVTRGFGVVPSLPLVADE